MWPRPYQWRKTAGIKGGWKTRKVGAVIVIGWLVVVYAATVSGHWKSGVSDMEFMMRLRQIDSNTYQHPTNPMGPTP